MARFSTRGVFDDNGKQTGQENVPYTPAEEAVADLEEAQADADALESSWDRFRTERNTKLASSDWTQSPDSPLASEAKTEWATYRQSLRDLPASTEDPANPSWPDAPS